MTTFTPAVLITGYDNRQNPFAFWKSINGWVDSYNECATDIDFVRKHVFPHVQQAVIGSIIMTGAEWVEAGCPISLSDEQITAIEEATRLESQYEKPQADEADWFTKPDSIISREWQANAIAEAEFDADTKQTYQSAYYDFTPFPSNMPDIDFGNIDEIPF